MESGGYELKERPILFSAPMVRAILDGRKTQTRRVAKPDAKENEHKCPHGERRDRLWVRETFAPVSGGAIYRADGERQPGSCCGCAWKPSIFMPRVLSRITLEITEVRVQWLQEISEEDALAEGCSRWKGVPGDGEQSAVQAYVKLWDSINAKKHPWVSNPWVWAITFKQA